MMRSKERLLVLAVLPFLAGPAAPRAAQDTRAMKPGAQPPPARLEDHGPAFPGAVNPPDYKAGMVKWFDTYLRRSGS
ncbi:MAG: hypothetical protein ACRD15_00830 [Vicinamibacterales bacterium]